jgi:purine-binding chemotaxis protein CheW
LRERARRLARPTESAQETGETIEVVEFRLAYENYAIESRLVQEVQPFKDLTRVPCTPPFVVGIVNVRGRIVPVIDLTQFLDLPRQGVTDLHAIILVRHGELEVGILVDIIVGVRSLLLAELQASLATLSEARSKFLKGITAERVIVLDLERILADPKIIVHEEVEA